MGTWYPYSFYSVDAGDSSIQNQRTNIVDVYTAINDSRLPFSNTPAVVVTQVKTWNDATTGQCGSLYEPCFFSANGWQAALTSYLADGTPDGADETLILYSDFNSFVLFFVCFDRNLTSGNCDDPFFYTSTRTRGDQLSQSQKDTISATLTQQVSQYSLSSSCFTSRSWNTSSNSSSSGYGASSSGNGCPGNANPACYAVDLYQLEYFVGPTTF